MDTFHTSAVFYFPIIKNLKSRMVTSMGEIEINVYYLYFDKVKSRGFW